jgi:hypothetical protein
MFAVACTFGAEYERRNDGRPGIRDLTARGRYEKKEEYLGVAGGDVGVEAEGREGPGFVIGWHTVEATENRSIQSAFEARFLL